MDETLDIILKELSAIFKGDVGELADVKSEMYEMDDKFVWGRKLQNNNKYKF